MLATILEILKGLLAAIPIFEKYFPAKTPEQTVEDGAKSIDQRLADEQKTGRPE